MTNVADGLLVTDAPKTLAEIQRQFVECVDPSNIVDTFRIAPWTAADIRAPRMPRLSASRGPSAVLLNLEEAGVWNAAYRTLVGWSAIDRIAANPTDKYPGFWQVIPRLDGIQGFGVEAVVDLFDSQGVLEGIRRWPVALCFGLSQVPGVHLLKLKAFTIDRRLEVGGGAFDAAHRPKVGVGVDGLRFGCRAKELGHLGVAVVLCLLGKG